MVCADPAWLRRRAMMLGDYPAGCYGCLTGWANALFEVRRCAAVRAGPVASVPVLSLQPIFRRSHWQLYRSGPVAASTATRPVTCRSPTGWRLAGGVRGGHLPAGRAATR